MSLPVRKNLVDEAPAELAEFFFFALSDPRRDSLPALLMETLVCHAAAVDADNRLRQEAGSENPSSWQTCRQNQFVELNLVGGGHHFRRSRS